MTIKADASERINEKIRALHGGDDAMKRRVERRAYLLREQLTTSEGREFFWEFVANAKALSMKAYTGNADCYYILGLRATPEELLRAAKQVDFKLYQKMEYEAMRLKRIARAWREAQ